MELPDHKDLKGLLDLRDRAESMELLVRRGHREQQGHKDRGEPLVSLDHKDHKE
jgi:hypothetical protein